jgi:hypothetical protein
MRPNIEDHLSGGGKRADGERVEGVPMTAACVEPEEDVLACFPGHLGWDRNADGGIWKEDELGFGFETVECGTEEENARVEAWTERAAMK